MNEFTNKYLADLLLDQAGDLSDLLALAQLRLGDDSGVYCVSSPVLIEFVLSNRQPDLSTIWLREICSRLICLENKDAARLFDVRMEE